MVCHRLSSSLANGDESLKLGTGQTDELKM